jgi:dipeptidyl aminopeptidase/acylaminoacyl peptidase
VNALPLVPPGQVFAPDAELGGLRSYLGRQDPIQLTPRVPVMLVQGTDDAAVSPAGVDQLAKAMCGKGVALDYRVYDGQDHRGVIAASLRDVQDFVDTVMAGEPIDNCPR